MILRLRQLCCHPNLILVSSSAAPTQTRSLICNHIQSLAEGFDDPTMLMGSDGDKELTRAIKSKGHAWVNQVCMPAADLHVLSHLFPRRFVFSYFILAS